MTDVLNSDSEGRLRASSRFVGLFQADDVADERILHFILRGLMRTTSGQAYAASFVPQVGLHQGEHIELRHRVSALPADIQREIEHELGVIDLSKTGPRVIKTRKIGSLRVTSASIASQYDINLGSIILVHTARLSHRALSMWLNIFEGLISFRKEARALGHHRLLLGLDRSQRQALDQSIGEIVNSAIHPHKTIIFVLDEGEIFRASYISGVPPSALEQAGLHVGKGKNLVSLAYDTREAQTAGEITNEPSDPKSYISTGMETYAVRHGYASCMVSPVFNDEQCYCLIVCFFRRPNAVSVVEHHIVSSMARLLSDYYRLWYRNYEIEKSYAQADEVLRQVRQLLLIVDVLHDAAEDLATARAQIGMLNPKTDAEQETLKIAKAILDSLITATTHFKSFYRRREERDVVERMSWLRTPFRPDRVSPFSIVSEIERKYKNQLGQNRILLTNACKRDFSFWGVQQCVKRSIDNAVKNSIYQLQQKSHVHREIRISLEVEEGRQVAAVPAYTARTIAIEIADNGPGISPDLLATVRQRYVSHRGGMGLGVPIMEAACETHGGSLNLSSVWGKGFEVTLRFRELAGGS